MQIRMLLVEDEVSIVFAIREFFSHAGYVVVTSLLHSEAGTSAPIVDPKREQQ